MIELSIRTLWGRATSRGFSKITEAKAHLSTTTRLVVTYEKYLAVATFL